MKRDKITRDYATARIKSQLSDDYLRARADYVIDNSGKTEATDIQVSEIARKILSTENK